MAPLKDLVMALAMVPATDFPTGMVMVPAMDFPMAMKMGPMKDPPTALRMVPVTVPGMEQRMVARRSNMLLHSWQHLLEHRYKRRHSRLDGYYHPLDILNGIHRKSYRRPDKALRNRLGRTEQWSHQIHSIPLGNMLRDNLVGSYWSQSHRLERKSRLREPRLDRHLDIRKASLMSHLQGKYRHTYLLQ